MFREAKPTRNEKVIGSILIGSSTHNTSSPGMRRSVPMWLGSGVDPEGLEYRLLPCCSPPQPQNCNPHRSEPSQPTTLGTDRSPQMFVSCGCLGMAKTKVAPPPWVGV
jgi:hypothetical protein